MVVIVTLEALLKLLGVKWLSLVGNRFKLQLFSQKIKNKVMVLPRSKFRLNYFCKGKLFFIQKGLFWRSLLVRDDFKKKHIGSYIFSRKPFSKVFLKKKKRR